MTSRKQPGSAPFSPPVHEAGGQVGGRSLNSCCQSLNKCSSSLLVFSSPPLSVLRWILLPVHECHEWRCSPVGEEEEEGGGGRGSSCGSHLCLGQSFLPSTRLNAVVLQRHHQVKPSSRQLPPENRRTLRTNVCFPFYLFILLLSGTVLLFFSPSFFYI